MSLVSFFNNVRRLPEARKRRAAFWLALTLTVLIVLFWLISFQTATESGGDTAQKRNGAGPVADVFQSVSGAAADILNAVNDVKNELLAPAEVSGGKEEPSR